ncbi:hypothetical protein CWB99_00010 [Pseudoalteromonas rubra]|uniref:DUF3718 domain-containing protein n=1 Tax=Pseudoalteromonas rubra TaxID=43658 RepID=A0A5S3WTY1_9GAMM|nr:hypothetical protein [Pseudoalteromonas rubra]TMP31844.1 hypothetical protein CWC00_14625 [Pseudoalteromonas rubra]TMP33073.1 hypothetical protein CWB99_00010 [Pseudoalteromonas rubra]
MRTYLLLGLALFGLLVSNGVYAQSTGMADKVYTSEGYPYKNLIMKAKRVELIYSEEGSTTTCRVKVHSANKVLESDNVNVSRQDFNNAPVTQCLARKTAKAFLGQL